MNGSLWPGEGQMQRDYWYSSARDAQDLATPEQVGQIAGSRTVKRLGARPIKTGQYPVLFEAPLASGLIGTLISAISGGNLYRKSSFLLDSLGQPVTASHIDIAEDPHVKKGKGSWGDCGCRLRMHWLRLKGVILN